MTILALGCAALLATGCKTCKPRAYDIVVERDPYIRNTTVRIDIIGVNASTRDRLAAYPVTDYFKPDDAMRRDKREDTHQVSFIAEDDDTKKISSNDKKWKRWLDDGATDLVVLADLFEVGDDDRRRLILPLGRCRWDRKDGGTIRIRISESMIELRSTLLTPKK